MRMHATNALVSACQRSDSCVSEAESGAQILLLGVASMTFWRAGTGELRRLRVRVDGPRSMSG